MKNLPQYFLTSLYLKSILIEYKKLKKEYE